MEFVKAHLEEAVQVYFGLQASEVKSSIPKKLDYKISKREAKLERYEAKLESTRNALRSIKDLSKIKFHGKLH